MSARRLTPEEDKALWVETRLTVHRSPMVTLARRKALGVAYDKITQHATPTNVKRYGARQSDYQLMMR